MSDNSEYPIVHDQAFLDYLLGKGEVPLTERIGRMTLEDVKRGMGEFDRVCAENAKWNLARQKQLYEKYFNA